MLNPVLLLSLVTSFILCLGACAGSEAEAPLFQRSSLSDCGGFEDALLSEYDPRAEYCDHEVFHWRYDPSRETLELEDSRALLNCCGDHHIEAELLDGVLVVTETDMPEWGDARCGCMCTFDFSLSVEGVSAEPIMLHLVRHVTDDGAGEELLWQGEIDLTRGGGAAIIDHEDAGIWCE